MNTQPTHKQKPETPIMSDTSDNISDKSLHGSDRQALRADITARYENTLRSLGDALKVEQCDRQAAADYMRVIGDSRWSQHGILRGFCDNCSIVIAFARHRIAAVRAAALADLAALDGETM